MQKFSPLVSRLRRTTLSFGAASFHPPLALMPSEKTGGFDSTATKDNHSFKHCKHPFIYASGCLNPEHGQLRDDDAYRRWQVRMVCYRRDGKSSRPNSHRKNRRHHSGQSRGYHQDQGQVNCHNDNTHTCRITMVVFRPRPPLLPPLLLLE